MAAVKKAVVLAGTLGLLLLGRTSPAQTTERAEAAQLEQLRREVASEIQLSAYNLVDELAHGWMTDPLFEEPTDVVLAHVGVPVGLGTALQGVLENHVAAVLIKNPSTNLRLVHCPACTAVVVHSGPEGTVLSRGIDDPAALKRFETERSLHALFIDVEAEGTWLVLRARITRLDPDLPIIFARTISSAASAPSMLRNPDDIKSTEEARQELMDALNDRGTLNVPLRLSVRLFDDSGSGINPPPFLWLQSGVELSLTQARAWTASIVLGYGWVPENYDGFMGQVRVHRLLTGTSRSFVSPDLYGFLGASIFAVTGPAAAIFRRTQPTPDDILADAAGNNPAQVFAGFHAGLELRLGNRLGAAVLAEFLPAYLDNERLSTYLGIFHSIGTEIAVWF